MFRLSIFNMALCPGVHSQHGYSALDMVPPNRRSATDRRVHKAETACSLRTTRLVAQQESTVYFNCGGRVSEEKEVKSRIQWTRLIAASAAPLDVLSQ